MCPSPSASVGSTGSKSAPPWTAQFNGGRRTIPDHPRSHLCKGDAGGHRVNVGDTFSALPSSDPTYEFDDEGVSESGVDAGRLLDLNTRWGKRINKTQDYSAHISWEPTDNLTLSADVQRVVSSMDLTSMTAFVEPRGPLTVDFDLRGDTPRLTYSAPGDPQLFQSNYWWSAAMDHFEKNDADHGPIAPTLNMSSKIIVSSNRSASAAGQRTVALLAVRQAGTGALSRQHWSCPDEFTECQPTAFLNEQGGEGFAPAAQPRPAESILPVRLQRFLPW